MIRHGNNLQNNLYIWCGATRIATWALGLPDLGSSFPQLHAADPLLESVYAIFPALIRQRLLRHYKLLDAGMDRGSENAEPPFIITVFLMCHWHHGGNSITVSGGFQVCEQNDG